MKLLNAEEVAYILSIPVSSAYAVMKKELTPIKIGARLRVDAEEVHTYIRERKKDDPAKSRAASTLYEMRRKARHG